MEDQILIAFGAHFKKFRIAKGLSQEQLALKADLDRTYISGIERGKRNVSLLNIVRLAEALDQSPKQLFDFELKE